MEGYAPILVLGSVAALLIFVTLFTSKILAPFNPTARKRTTYESGEITQGSGRGPIAIQYYPYILIFLILDVEVLFLVPFSLMLGEWFTTRQEMVGIIVLDMAIFVGTLLLGWYYAYRKGAMQWVR